MKMDFEAVRKAVQSLPAAVEERPFGPDALVYKVKGKMFALMPAGGDPPRVSLKCDPEHSIDLRTAFSGIQPGYYMNKRHWNTVALDGTVPDSLIKELIEHSYQRVVSGLKRADREALAQQAGVET